LGGGKELGKISPLWERGVRGDFAAAAFISFIRPLSYHKSEKNETAPERL
jgi:hypothetical protein